MDKLVLSTVNAPYKRAISVVDLEECIEKINLDDWLVHIATFFTDVEPFLVLDFAAAHGISESKLAEAYWAVKVKTGEQNSDLESKLVPLASSAR